MATHSGTFIIGKVAEAEKNMEQCRVLMRLSKNLEDKAEYKREFKKARNKVIAMKNNRLTDSIIKPVL